MNKQQFTILVSILVAGILFATNPKEVDHRAAVKDKANEVMQKSLAENASSDDAAAGLGALLGGYVIDRLIETAVTRDNYLLFSTTRIHFQDQDKVIGFGILGAVYISADVDKALKDKKK